MDTPAQNSFDIAWTSHDVDLSNGDHLANTRDAMAGVPGVNSVVSYAISSERAVIRISTESDLEAIRISMNAIFGPNSTIDEPVTDGRDRPIIAVETFEPPRDSIDIRSAFAGAFSNYRTRSKIPELVFLVLAAFLTGITFIPEYPPGIDTEGHLFKAWAIAREAERGMFSLLHWTQDWYVGHPVLYYYPPGSYIAVGAIDYFLNDIYLSHRFYLFVSFFTGGLAAYALGRVWLSRFPSIMMAFFYVLSPYTLKMIYWEGNIPRTATLPLLPLVVLLAVKLAETGNRIYFVALSITLAVLIVAHQMPAAALLALLAAFLVIWGLGNVRFMNLVQVGVSLGTGLLLSSFWLLPAVFGSDLPDTPNLENLPERLPSYSATPSQLFNPLTQLRDFEASNIYIGTPIFIAALLGLFLWNRTRLALAMTAAIALGIIVAFGANAPYYENIELLRKWFPERFLQPTALFLAIMAAVGISRLHQNIAIPSAVRLWIVAALLILTVIDIAPFMRHAYSDPRRPLEIFDSTLVGNHIAETGNSDRRIFTYTGTDWSTNFAPIRFGGVSSTSGWNPEGTPHSTTLGNVNAALARDRHDYVLRLMAMFDAGYAYINSDSPFHRALAETMVDNGWLLVDLPSKTALDLYEYPEAPGAKILVNPLNVTTIGAGGRSASVASPNVADWQGYSNVIEEQDSDYLALVDGILLFGSASLAAGTSEAKLRPLIEQGKTVYEAIDASAGVRLFGIESEQIRYSGSITVRNAPGVDLLPAEGLELSNFGYQGDDWTAAVIVGDAEPLLVADINGEERIVVGQKRIGSGRIVGIGLSLITHVDLKSDPAAAFVTGQILGYDETRTLNPDPVPVQNLEWGQKTITFDYNLEEATSALVSLTYFPGWSASIDGKSVELHRHERLTLMNLPPGEHSVKLSYGLTNTQLISIGISFVGVLILIVLFVPQRRYFRLLASDIGSQATRLNSISLISQIESVESEPYQTGVLFSAMGTKSSSRIQTEGDSLLLRRIDNADGRVSVAVREGEKRKVISTLRYIESGEWHEVMTDGAAVELIFHAASSVEWSIQVQSA